MDCPEAGGSVAVFVYPPSANEYSHHPDPGFDVDGGCWRIAEVVDYGENEAEVHILNKGFGRETFVRLWSKKNTKDKAQSTQPGYSPWTVKCHPEQIMFHVQREGSEVVLGEQALGCLSMDAGAVGGDSAGGGATGSPRGPGPHVSGWGGRGRGRGGGLRPRRSRGGRRLG